MNWVDVLSIVAWGSGAAWGLSAGLMRAWVPFLFLLAGVGFAGTLGIVIGPALSWLVDSEGGQAAVAFLIVLSPMLLLGIWVTVATRKPLSVAFSLVELFPMALLFNRAGGILMGALLGCVLIAVLLLSLQQIPVNSVGAAIEESSFASGPIKWVDRYVASVEFSCGNTSCR